MRQHGRRNGAPTIYTLQFQKARTPKGCGCPVDTSAGGRSTARAPTGENVPNVDFGINIRDLRNAGGGVPYSFCYNFNIHGTSRTPSPTVLCYVLRITEKDRPRRSFRSGANGARHCYNICFLLPNNLFHCTVCEFSACIGCKRCFFNEVCAVAESSAGVKAY